MRSELRLKATWLGPALCCALLCAPGVWAQDKKPAGLDLDDLGAKPVKAKKQIAPGKVSKAPWLKGNRPGKEKAEAAPKPVSSPAPVAAKAPPLPAPVAAKTPSSPAAASPTQPTLPAKVPLATQAAPVVGPSVFVATPPGASPPSIAPATAPSSPAATAQPPAATAPPPPKPPSAAAPPLLKLSTQYGICMPRSDLVDEATAADAESGLKTIAFQAPMSARPTLLYPKAVPCKPEDDACFAALGAEAGVDEVVVASLSRVENALGLSVRRVDVLTRKRVAEARQGGLSTDRLELKAWSEALLCRLIMPVGCGGELLVETSGAELQIEGTALPKSPASPERLKLAVGVHAIRAVRDGKAGPVRLLPVLREPSTQLAFAVHDSPEGPRLVAPQDKALPASQAPAAAVASVAAPEVPARKWAKPVGYTAAALGAAALIGGVVQGLRASSMISSAESAYEANGGAYRPANAAELASGNSAAKSANLLFGVGGVLAAAGLVVALAF